MVTGVYQLTECIKSTFILWAASGLSPVSSPASLMNQVEDLLKVAGDPSSN